ncbi:sigma-70 family RNA polymerase sigma factor [Streptomyces sp. NBC_01476]|uniref:sigma-70 family RNA polymerase sigma factor n=1 Tax=Streptomyces sp. NBC_01476 TaxID=2903881 RepID=UPI002E3603E9|nr:sigma-70 family RNA polymerase sigma factor [Streptomyces sp. NBC_01476]
MRAGDRVGPDPGMVVAARAGDQRALDLLVAECLPLVYNIVGRALDGHDDVDDVVQETLLRVVRGLGELRDPAAFRSWLVAIAVRQVRDREQARKASWHQQTALDTAELIPDPASDFASVTILRLGLTDQRREIAEATRWLDPDDRPLLALWWLEETGDIGRSELADALGLTRQHAAVKVQRMKEQLETSRTVVRVLGAAEQCPDLHQLAVGWDGVPSPLWRKRFARHVRGCEVCGRVGGVLLPMDRLLSGLPMLPVPVGLPFATPHPGLGPLPAHSPAAPPPASPAASPAAPGTAAHPHPPVRSGARRGAHGLRRARPRLLRGPFGVPAAAMGAVAAVAAGTLLAVHLSAGSPAPVAQATASPRPSPTLRLTTAPAPTTASPSPSPSKKKPPTKKPAAKAATRAPRKAPAPPPAAPVSSVRKGVGVWSFNGVNTALDRSGAGWFYTWSTTHSGISGPGFVPMIWGADSVNSGTLAQAKAAGPYLLGFNEPDMAAQSNMSADKALSLWPQLMDTGKVLGSPAVAYGGDTPGGWLDTFMSGAKAKGYRVDFITLHWYGGDFTTPNAVAQLKSYLQAVYNRYHKPIWLTEFALIDFSNGTRFPTDQQQAAFVTAATKMLDGLPYLQRYAWFGLGADDSKPSSGLFHSGPSETPAGRAFEAAR